VRARAGSQEDGLGVGFVPYVTGVQLLLRRFERVRRGVPAVFEFLVPLELPVPPERMEGGGRA